MNKKLTAVQITELRRLTVGEKINRYKLKNIPYKRNDLFELPFWISKDVWYDFEKTAIETGYVPFDLLRWIIESVNNGTILKKMEVPDDDSKDVRQDDSKQKTE